MSIGINIDKAKQIAHDLRREARAQEFAPLDRKATIPSEAAQAEEQRQQVREKYAQAKRQRPLRLSPSPALRWQA